MDVKNVITRLKTNLSELQEQRKTEALRIALDATALLKLRIQTSGQNADGGSFPPYVPSYARRRRKNGLQTGYVDFTDRGRLWANVQPRVELDEQNRTLVVIGARDSENNAKLLGAVKKRGNILRLSQDEIDLVADANRERLAKVFDI